MSILIQYLQFYRQLFLSHFSASVL
uniref:Uncharacterized protein n=1 Tax=Anguilla anguilla TaxID=7936 RepID=A0A0E9UKN0_ANGAN